jgi:hypothetical protein
MVILSTTTEEIYLEEKKAHKVLEYFLCAVITKGILAFIDGVKKYYLESYFGTQTGMLRLHGACKRGQSLSYIISKIRIRMNNKYLVQHNDNSIRVIF